MGFRVAIIGGGPGGLMTAYQLQQRCHVPFEATIYEAGDRLGGKVLTQRFAAADVIYEAGAAELYDYSHVGEDPLRELVERLGFTTKPMQGPAVEIDGQIVETMEDVASVLGEPARRALEAFDERAKRWMNPAEFYESDWQMSNADPKTQRTFAEELEDVTDASARRLLRTMVHSDLATEPHRTNASYGLQNYLMNDPAYLRLYTVEGGIEQVLQELIGRVNATIRLNDRVERVERVGSKLRVQSQSSSEEYDFVVVALPNHFLPSIAWRGEALERAMLKHHAHYDYPAHYLRVSILFREPFWHGALKDSFTMLEAFGGCCLYDESSRNECGPYGVLGWLLAGTPAMNVSNLSDAEIVERVLDSLPAPLQHGRQMVLESHVHRWIGAVNAMPGGSPVLDMEARHIPEAAHPNLLVVGDYLFDSTLNGVLDSADYVAETLSDEMETNLAAARLHPAAQA